MAADDGNPIHYGAVKRGTPVYAVDGQKVGVADEVVSKARDLMAPVIGPAKASRLIETVMTLETVKEISSLRPLLQRG